MKKITVVKTLFFIASVAGMLIFFNLNASTKQCVDNKCRVIRVPLYLKALDFFNRHFNYALLARNITKGAKNQTQRALLLLEWTYTNIKENPPGLPIVDDHAWHIIIRGYGVDDQHQDVFTTLCNYAGLKSFFNAIYIKDTSKSFSFVCLNNAWVLFDAYNGVYFKGSSGQIASITDVIQGDWQVVSLSKSMPPGFYAPYINQIKQVDFDAWRFSRSAIQSPIRRFIFWLKEHR